MTTHFIGKVYSSRLVGATTKDGDDWVNYNRTEVTLVYEGLDLDGNPIMQSFNIYDDEDERYRYVDLKDKLVAIPFITEKNKVDKTMPILELDKNPLDYSQYDKSKPKSQTPTKQS